MDFSEGEEWDFPFILEYLCGASKSTAFFALSFFFIRNIQITYTSGKFLKILFSSLRSPTILPCTFLDFIIPLPIGALYQIILTYYNSLLADFHSQYLLASYAQKIASKLLRELVSLQTPSRFFSNSTLIMTLYLKNLQWCPLFYCIKSNLLFLVSSLSII